MSKIYKIAYFTLQSIHESTACKVHVSEIISALRQRDLNIDLYCPTKSNKKKKRKFHSKTLDFFHLQFMLMKNLKNYDLLYVRAHYMSFPAAFLAKLYKIPVVQEINGPFDDVFIIYPWLKLVKYPLIYLQRLQYIFASHLIPVSNNLAEWLVHQAKHNRITAISNGANIDFFHPNVAKPVNGVESKHVIFYGSMSKWHDIDTPIAAISDPAWPADTKLVLLGRGINERQKQLVNNNPNIIYLGPKDYSEIPNYITQALAGLVTMNDVEGRAQKGLSPLKLYETLACGIPVIVSDYPGQADFVRHYKCGIVTKPKCSSELARAVNSLSKDMNMAKELGNNGRKALEKNHSWWKISGDIHDIIIKCIKENQR